MPKTQLRFINRFCFSFFRWRFLNCNFHNTSLTSPTRTSGKDLVYRILFSAISLNQTAIKASILNRFGDVGGFNRLLVFQIGNSAGNFQDRIKARALSPNLSTAISRRQCDSSSISNKSSSFRSSAHCRRFHFLLNASVEPDGLGLPALYGHG